MPSLRPVSVLALSGATAGMVLALAAPAGAATPPMPDRTPVTVTVSLRSRHPSAGAQQRVTSWLASSGFTVTGRTATTITARGTAGRARSAFGTRLRPLSAGRYTTDRRVGPGVLAAP